MMFRFPSCICTHNPLLTPQLHDGGGWKRGGEAWWCCATRPTTVQSTRRITQSQQLTCYPSKTEYRAYTDVHVNVTEGSNTGLPAAALVAWKRISRPEIRAPSHLISASEGQSAVDLFFKSEKGSIMCWTFGKVIVNFHFRSLYRHRPTYKSE